MTRVEQARAIQRPGETLISALSRLNDVHTHEELIDPLGPARGILVGLALAVPFWVLVAYLAWRAWR